MPSYVVKPARDRDCYVIWSEIVDAPTHIGTRTETEAVLKQRGDWDDGGRLDRADRNGSSALWPEPGKPIYGWDDDGFMVANTFPDHPFRWLPRANLEPFVRAVDEDRLDEALTLTEPCEGD